MVSRFETRFVSQGLPLLERQFSQSADFFQTDDTDEITIACFIDLGDVSQGTGFSDLEGRVTVRTADMLARVSSFGSLSGVRIGEEEFHVYAHSTSEFGVTVFNIRRKASEQDHTNMFDMNDQQAVWRQE